MTHLKDESLSAFIDGEVEGAERALIEEHLRACSDCSARRDRLQAAGAALASIAEVSPTPDETRSLRQAVLASRPSRWQRIAPPAWAAAGGLAVLLVAFFAFATLRGGRSSQDQQTAAAPKRAASPLETIAISSDNQELVDLVRADANIKSQIGKYRVSDVKTKQQEVLADYSDAAAPAAARTGAAPPTGASAPTAATEAQRQSGLAEQSTAGPSQERSLGYCLRAWVDLRSNPTIPVTGRPADFLGQPAWLLVYAYSLSKEPNAELDLLTILVVRRTGCERDDAILRLLSIAPSPAPNR